MSNDIYPTLPGLAYGIIRSVIPPPVEILTTPSDREYRARNAVLPRYQYSLVYEFLRASLVTADLQTLVGFYNAHGGPFDSFLFTDADDCTVSNGLFGTGDGSTRIWQLVRQFGGFAEPVYDFNGGVTIFDNGTNVGAGASVSSTGLVTFTTAPVAGHSLTWTGSFYRRVRFLGDRLDTTKMMQNLYEAKKVDLLSTKA